MDESSSLKTKRLSRRAGRSGYAGFLEAKLLHLYRNGLSQFCTPRPAEYTHRSW